MPSLMLNLRSRTYEDGDILHACNTHRAECVHVQHICHTREWPKTRGLHNNGSLPQRLLVRTSQYHFRRLNKTEVLRTNVVTREEETFGNPEIDVDLFVRRRLHFGKLPMFGEPSLEEWYGKSREMTPAALTSLWTRITQRRPDKLRADHGEWPYTTWHFNKEGEWVPGEMEGFLIVPVKDMSKARMNRLVEPEMDLTDPDNPIMLRKRKRRVQWKLRSEVLKEAAEADILDPEKTIDLRAKMAALREDLIVEEKV